MTRARKIQIVVLIVLLLVWLIFPSRSARARGGTQPMVTAVVKPRSFAVEVRTVGELEAKRSQVITSSIRGDLGKVIYLVPDGLTVPPNDVLVRLDPTPFEEKIEDLSNKIRESEANVQQLQQQMEWELHQAVAEKKTAKYEVETAEMELAKLTQGDGPQETTRLKSLLKKAQTKYEDIASYADQIEDLQKEGYLNPTEVKLAVKKLNEEKESYEDAKLQYDTFVIHTHPMQLKKAETALRRAQIKQEEAQKGARYRASKAAGTFHQAEQTLADLRNQKQMAQRELASCEIRAPAHGMVVHREAYRAGQMRKPRLGDVVMKNQPLLDLPDLTTMIVRTRVREVDLFKIQVGQKATVQVDAYPDMHFSGKVESIGVLALADPMRSGQEKYFEVRVALTDADERLRPGMTSRAIIHAADIDSQLTVPIDALFTEEDCAYCYVPHKKGYKRKQVAIGTANDEWVMVESGLSKGEKVCLVKPQNIL